MMRNMNIPTRPAATAPIAASLGPPSVLKNSAIAFTVLVKPLKLIILASREIYLQFLANREI